jgi:hypothetical protein
VSGFGGSGSGINSVIEAKRLLFGVPPEDDPAEDHMNRVLTTVFGWTVVSVILAAAPLWLLGALPSAIAVFAATAIAVAAIFRIGRRRNRGRRGPESPPCAPGTSSSSPTSP